MTLQIQQVGGNEWIHSEVRNIRNICSKSFIVYASMHLLCIFSPEEVQVLPSECPFLPQDRPPCKSHQQREGENPCGSSACPAR